jgi:hypothetical protein
VEESGIADCYAIIEVPGSLHAIQNPRNTRELKTLLIVADKDLSSEYSHAHQYYVRSRRGRE